jgi:hypothetical protein
VYILSAPPNPILDHRIGLGLVPDYAANWLPFTPPFTKATLFQRFVGYGNIVVVSTDGSGTFVMENLPDAMAKREQIRVMSNKAREAKGVRTIINE